jgi:hypothetical protein
VSWRCGRALDQFIAEARELVPDGRVDTIGDADHSSRESDHNPCDCHSAVCAGDVFTYQYDCAALAENLRQLALAGDYRIKYVIFNRRIFSGPGQSYSAGVWRDYDGANSHTDHLHISLQHGAEQFDRTDRWNVFGATAAGIAPETVEVDVPIFAKLDTGQTLLVMSGVVSIGSDDDRKELLAAVKDVDHIAQVGGGTAKQLAGMAGHA